MHYIGLVFVNKDVDNVDTILEPFDEQNEDYKEFEDRTEEVEDLFARLPEKDDESGYPCDLQRYPDIDTLAKKYFCYKVIEVDGKKVYGYMTNPNGKYDYYVDGGRWDGYIYGKDGQEHNELPYEEVDWEKMFTPVETKYTDIDGNERSYMDVHVPYAIVNDFGEWFDFGWKIENEDEWNKTGARKIIEGMKERAENIVVYAIDFHD